ncbi:MAG: Asp-tRNA(Asn)/Glu-tRNA(Gln) amidotransferase subunit GatB [Patescibacteria group bacterium]|mgnify:CR=1 FL=1
MTLEPVIGLEIHVQLKTKSKMFCACDNAAEEASPNTAVCPVCMGHPGTLPVINRQAVEYGLLAGLALNCRIPELSKFDRKNYFYPDLPKGYQISQFDQPIAAEGYLEIDIPGAKKDERSSAKIRITRVHLEDDAAKNFHSPDGKSTLVDYNRAGTPLIEIVTEPDFASPLEAKTFLQELRNIMRYLGVSSADMEKGHLRCDANISLREVIDDPARETEFARQLNPKTEIKNLNSFKAVERALEYEIMRQTKLWQAGTPPAFGATRGWNETRGVTEEQRGKEEAHDYRYFPEPDLPPMELREIADELRGKIPELPAARRARFILEYGFSPTDARILTDDKHLADYAEAVISELVEWLASLPEVEGSREEIWDKNKSKLSKLVSGWLLSKLGGIMAENKMDFRALKIDPENFAEFLALIYQNKINSSMGLALLTEMAMTGGDPSQIIEEKGLAQVNDTGTLEAIIAEIIDANPKVVADYKAGKTASVQYLLGQIMKKTKGAANPEAARDLLIKKLS